jgi:hypothetical protein
MIGSLDLVRLSLGVAQREALRVGRCGFAGDATFSRLLLGIRLQSMPLPVPQLTTVGFLGIWPDVADLERFRAGPLRSWAAADRRLTLTLRPVQSFGSWCGGDPLGGYRTEPAGGPVLLVTHSRARARSMPRFLLADGPVVRALGRAEGRLWNGGFIDGMRTLDTGTLSLWRSTADATRFAYAPGIHHEAVRAQREGGWFSESWFGRFAVEAAEGRWRGLDLAALPPAP